MKKLKILGVISFTLIGGGALVSIPLAITSCKEKMKFGSPENFANFLRKHVVIHKEDNDFDYINSGDPVDGEGNINVGDPTKYNAFLSYFNSIDKFDCKELFVAKYWVYTLSGAVLPPKIEVNITKFSNKIVEYTFSEERGDRFFTDKYSFKWLDNGIYEIKESIEEYGDKEKILMIKNGCSIDTGTDIDLLYLFNEPSDFGGVSDSYWVLEIYNFKDLYPNLVFSTLPY